MVFNLMLVLIAAIIFLFTILGIKDKHPLMVDPRALERRFGVILGLLIWALWRQYG